MRDFADIAARVRPSIVGVVSPTNRGTGYCALPNGLIVTSLDVVGFEREVQLVLDDGSTVSAAVVRANVALDVALILPLEPLPLPPLEAGREPRIGDDTLLVGRVGVEPILAMPRIVSTGRVCEGFAHIQLDRPLERALTGAPLLDQFGGVLGFVVRPRRSRRSGDRNAHEWIHSLVLPGPAFEGGLLSADGDPAELLELLPEFGCPQCDTVFEPEMDRCLECGALLPHRFVRQQAAETPLALKGLFAAKAALASLGISANRARVDRRTWRFAPTLQDQDTRTQVDLTIDATGDNLLLYAPVVRLPLEGFEPLYRHLLTLNDETSGPYRFGISSQIVYMSLAEPILTVAASTFPSTVSDFSRALSQYRATLQRYFGLEAAFEHDVDG